MSAEVPATDTGRFVTIHAHFYQPPRENPWLEAVEVESGAAPYHDWNERITTECYAPNTAARRVDGDNRILNIVNNYETISFNVGPTLLSWLERHRPDTYVKILEADRRSRARRGGHGNAIAQVYNHVIMPLATRADKVTEVRWGIEDFRHRFAREPEGIWLPETAVDHKTLSVLATAGLRFTILAPSQARRVRAVTGGPWREVDGERIDPTQPYLYRTPEGQSLALFFYSAPIARAIAFEGGLKRGETLAARVLAGFSSTGATLPRLVHAATDGESYGHHTPFGDMALAAALEQIEREGWAALTNYGAFLAAHPPTHEVEIVEGSSWSCAHGTERWRSDCACHAGHPGWQHRWRATLRETLDWLRDRLDPFFEERLGAVVKDPWQARDDYIHVVLDRSPQSKAAFFSRHQRVELDEARRVQALKLLELERHRLLMYTSCGWFFDDISGPEAVQVLKYAARATQLGEELGLHGLEAAVVDRLAAAPANVPELGNGAEIYRCLVRPSAVDLRRAAAHYAISGLLEPYGGEHRTYSFAARRLDDRSETFGDTTLALGRVRVQSRVTDEAEEHAFAVLRSGRQDFHCAVREAGSDPVWYEAMKADLLGCFGRAGVSETIHAMDRHFPGPTYSLKGLFLGELSRLLSEVAEETLERYAVAYQRTWEDSRRLMRDCRESGTSVPEILTTVARHVLQQQVTRELADVTQAGRISERALESILEARALGLKLDLGAAAGAVTQTVTSGLAALTRDGLPERVERLRLLVEAANELRLPVRRWRIQNQFFDLWREQHHLREILIPLARPLGFAPQALQALGT